MKKVLAAATAMIIGATAAVADPAVGLWKTEPGDTGGVLHVSVVPCGAEICGVIQKAVDKSGKTVADYEHKGKTMIWGMTPNGNGSYGGGQIWAADRDKTYKSKMQLSGNQLVVEGCVFGICRGQTWSRVN